jgi:cation transport regulator ChaC
LFHYFAYGSVVSLRHAREWCESHALDVGPFLKGEPARLEGYRLIFDVPSRFWSGLVADLTPDAASSVEGVIFTLDDSAREAVIRKEGVATGLYREVQATVSVGERRETASIFLAVEDRRVAPGPASSRYVEALREGAVERGLSQTWRDLLAAIPRDDAKPPPPGVSLGVRR